MTCLHRNCADFSPMCHVYLCNHYFLLGCWQVLSHLLLQFIKLLRTFQMAVHSQHTLPAGIPKASSVSDKFPSFSISLSELCWNTSPTLSGPKFSVGETTENAAVEFLVTNFLSHSYTLPPALSHPSSVSSTRMDHIFQVLLNVSWKSGSETS